MKLVNIFVVIKGIIKWHSVNKRFPFQAPPPTLAVTLTRPF